MTDQSPAASFEQVTSIDAESPTLIEGLPGHGLVAAIAVDQITSQLGLEHYGNVASDAFPPVVTFEDGTVQDLVRVYAGSDPDVMTLESDLALPQSAFEPLSRCVLEELADRFDRAIFLAGAPAESEDQIGEVTGVATTESIKEDLLDAGVRVPDENGLVGGITGALVRECYQAEVPAALLIVRSHPFLPDPQAAKSVIETALEPLVEFDVDTTALEEQADDIRQRMEQVATQYQQMAEQEGQQQQQVQTGMFQ
ncbi:proteasome assembly chaperone family protein [Natrarchaeobaculum aegyptiacum]|uniref:ATP-grasp superfamily enzyme n=1 Tax=Natrarchaeobaculum aegyptiacum TaxID=745377 RepID=A0A2Z2HUQ1_9EURY|nr:PAC2 family protein [Natrarchaeobaculum aegyptiacum]ARS90989.1 ATP-grasp superfamily enzyme [Natrarchaeobaculum aegyptiacum]